MKIYFRETTAPDLVWFNHYYCEVFSAGDEKAKEHYHATLNLLKAHPEIGKPYEGHARLRGLHIAKTPFSFLYYVESENILVVRVIDGRGKRPTSVLGLVPN